MKAIDAKHFLIRALIDDELTSDLSEYPYNLPIVQNFKDITFSPGVTFFVGENGTGKSTLLEALAVASGFNAEGGSRNFNFSTHATHSSLCDSLILNRGIKRPQDGYFLRAETFYNVASEIDSLDKGSGGRRLIDSYGGTSLHEQSHGESFFSLLIHRFQGEGLYLLDEPEAALSPSRQLAAIVRLHKLVEMGSQFIIATHSPILMAYPNAKIFVITEEGLKETSYKDTEHYQVTKGFLDDPERMINALIKSDDG